MDIVGDGKNDRVSTRRARCLPDCLPYCPTGHRHRHRRRTETQTLVGEETIYVTTAGPNFGGKRRWFVCDHSG